MNNQAAQTMHEPEDWQKIHVLMSVMEFRPLSDSERKEMHEALVSVRQSAALSQTAGVPEGYALVPVEPTPEMLAAWRGAQPKGYGTGINVKAGYRAMVAAAPAASGGESHPDALPDGTLSKSTAKRVEALSSNPNPVTPGLSSESGVSVSDPIAALRDKWATRSGSLTYDLAAVGLDTALEQALTQQRGECVGEVVAEGHALHECVSFYAGVKPLPIGTKLYTTPQPGAEALREKHDG